MKAQEIDSAEGIFLFFDFKIRKWKEDVAEESGVED